MIIYKYEVKAEAVNKIKIPIGGKILTVQMQNNIPQMWVACDPSREVITRRFVVIPTGKEVNLPEDGESIQLSYIGTFQLEGGALVFHLFELVPTLH
jgi:hypothetical protein